MNKNHYKKDYSIIIPAFNEEKCLPQTLERLTGIVKIISRISEIIVIDNNSSDRTEEIAKEFGAMVVFEPHQQIARNRNAGAKISNGKYLFFVEADTLVDKNLFQTSLDLLENGNICGGGALTKFSPGSSNDRLMKFLADL